MRVSSDDERYEGGSGPSVTVALVWLLFYLLVVGGWMMTPAPSREPLLASAARSAASGTLAPDVTYRKVP